MTTGNAVRAGAAYVEIGATLTGLERALRDATGRLAGFAGAGATVGQRLSDMGRQGVQFGSGLIAAAAAVAGFGAASALAFEKYGSLLDDTANQTGATIEGLQELSYAAQLTGSVTPFEDISGGLTSMQQGIVKLAQGSQKAQKAFALIGLSFADLDGLTAEEQFAKIADAFKGVESSAVKAAAAQGIFGGSGKALIPLLSGGSEQIKELSAEARKLGLVMSAEAAGEAASFGETLDRFKLTGKAAALAIGQAFTPAVKGVLTVITAANTAFTQFVSKNRELATALAAGAGVAALAGAALVGLGGFAIFATAGVGALIASLTALKVGLLALVSPVGLLTLGVAAGAYWFANYTDAGREMVAGLGTIFTDFYLSAVKIFQGISDAAATGDLNAIQAIFASTFNIIGANIYGGISAGFERCYTFAVDTANSILGIFVDISSAIAKVFSRIFRTAFGDNFAAGLDVIAYKAGLITKEEGRRRLEKRQESATSQEQVEKDIDAEADALFDRNKFERPDFRESKEKRAKEIADEQAKLDKVIADAAEARKKQDEKAQELADKIKAGLNIETGLDEKEKKERKAKSDADKAVGSFDAQVLRLTNVSTPALKEEKRQEEIKKMQEEAQKLRQKQVALLEQIADAGGAQFA